MPRVPAWFAALMDSLQMRGSNTDALLTLNDSDWKELLAFSDPAHLTLPLAQAAHAGFPQWVRDRLACNVTDNRQRFDCVVATYQEAATALGSAGIEFVVMKGFTQSPHFVKDPHMRMQSDIDLLCRQDQLDAARIALESIGYAEDSDRSMYRHADHMPAMKRERGWKWRGNMFDPEMPLSIELHFCLWNRRLSMIDIQEMEHFWERRTVRRVGELVFPVLDPVDQIGYFALHILRGAICGDWIVHHVLEMANFLHSHASESAFWSEWNTRHSAKFRNLQAIAFSLAEHWFSCDVHPSVRAQCAELPSSLRVWMHQCGGSLLEKMFGQNRDWVWLHVALLDSSHDRAAALRRAILPDRLPRVKDVPAVIDRRRATRIANQNTRYFVHLLLKGVERFFLVPRLLWQGAVLRLKAS